MSDLARRTGGPGFADAVTFAWADVAAERYGFARIGIADERASVLAVLFAGREPAGALAEGDLDVPAQAWERAEAGGLVATVEEPHARWSLAGAVGGVTLDLAFEASSPPAEIGPDADVSRVGGLAGYEQLCRVRGSAGGERIAGVGQRGHSWGSPDWGRIELARTLTAWEADAQGLTYSAVRPKGAKAHADEAVWAAVAAPERVLAVADPRLSTTYDGEGRQRRAGLELWLDEEDPYPHRASGEVLCGSTLDLGQLRLDCAFFTWRVDGRPAIGRYDLLRRA